MTAEIPSADQPCESHPDQDASQGSECLELNSRSQLDTERLGMLMAGWLTAGSVISLAGDLGAGKTAFVRGLAAGLHCRGPVASPTFTILMEHPASAGSLPLYHFDAYRLGTSEAFVELGLTEYFDSDGVSAIEWGDLIPDLLPERCIMICLSAMSQTPDSRHITVCWPGGRISLAGLARQYEAGDHIRLEITEQEED